MANKITKVKCSSSSASEQTEEDLRALVTKLRAELDAERKTTRQLRREKAIEVQRVREQEQTKASICLKDLAAKLHQERQQEVELQRETSRCKLEADHGKVIKVKDQEIKKLKQDLAKCQLELGEEVAKRGLSTSARGTFETERNKLLQEVKELNASRKQLEMALQAAGEAEKQKKLEFRQLQDSCKQELARVEKEANLEVKKLLEELKTKDNMLAMMERNIYPDKAKMLKNQVENLSIEELLNLSREVEKMSKTYENSKVMDACVVSGGCALQTIGLQKKLYELEKQVKFANGLHHAMSEKNNSLSSSNKQLEAKIKLLTEQINNLNCESQMNKAEIKRLNDVIVLAKNESEGLSDTRSELETYKQLYADVQSILACVRHDCQEKDRRIALLFKSQHKQKQKYEPKTVRFMLPDDDDKVPPDIPNESVDAENVFSFDVSAEDSENRLSDEMLIQSVHKDYEQLMEEHLKLEKYCSQIIQTQPAVRELAQQSWMLEKESLNIALWALEDKLRQSDEREQIMKCQLQDARDQNEELEFRILELEECTETTRSTYYEPEDVELMEKTRMLETQVFLLKQRLSQFESIDIDQLEKDAEDLPASFSEPVTDLVEGLTAPHERLSLENLRKLTASLSDSDDDNAMVQSFSTMTSGFDEISCISLDLDEKTDLCDVAEKSRSVFEGVNALVKNLCEDGAAANDLGWVSPKVDHSDVVDQSEAVPDCVPDFVPDCVPEDELSALAASDLWEESAAPIVLGEFSSSEEIHIQRIKDLQDQVDILEYNDTRYSKTIETLDQIEQQLVMSTFDDVKQVTEDATPLPVGSDSQFWTTGRNEIEQDICILKTNITEFTAGCAENMSEQKKEAQTALCKCSEKLEETERLLNDQKLIAGRLDEKIESLEIHQSTQFDSKDISARFDAISESVMIAPVDDSDSSQFFVPETNKVKSLKLCAMKAVVNEFKTDFKELKSLTDEFLRVIDGNVAESRLEESGGVSTCQDKLAQIKAARAELRLNTNLPFGDQRFDFFSPTSFESEWASSSHLETINHCLLQQIQDLEKERDLLQELVYKDRNVISEMSVQISELTQSEKALQKIVERLESAEEQTRAKFSMMEANCQKAKIELKKVESSEAALKLKLELHEITEAELNTKLRDTLESLQCSDVKYKNSIAELQQEKLKLDQHVDDLSSRVKSLESKETVLKQRVKSLESAELVLHDKVSELETSLTAAYDDVTRSNRQKDGLAQRVDLLEIENADLKHENAEMTESKCRLMSDLERLTESERFLKEANRKMWLSLQVSLGEREGEQGQRSARHGQPSCCIDDTFSTGNADKEIKQVDVEDPDLEIKAQSSSDDCAPVIVIQNASEGLRRAVELLGGKYPQIQAEFLATWIRLSAPQTSASGTSDTMQKFLTAMQLKSSHSSPVSSHSQAASSDGRPEIGGARNRGSWVDDGYASVEGGIRASHAGARMWAETVKGEESFWATVEDARDIHDVRAADRTHYWASLEDIMGINTSRLGMFIEFRDAETNTNIPTTAGSFPASLPQIRRHSDNQEPPPLPSSPPPSGESFFLPSQRGQHLDYSESADEASEIQDEDDGAGLDGARRVNQPDYLIRARSAGFNRKVARQQGLAKQLSGNVGASMDSVADSGMESMAERTTRKKCEILDQGTQTESATSLQTDDMTALLRMQLEQKDRNLIAKMNEVDRLTLEMRRWQQKAVAAGEEASKLSDERGALHDEGHSGEEVTSGDSKLFSSIKQTKKSRFEPYVSQIPVSVKQAVDHYKNIDLRSAQTSLRSPRSGAVAGSPTNQGSARSGVTSSPTNQGSARSGVTSSPTNQGSARSGATSSPINQGSVHTNGSSLSKALKFPSLLPRPIGEKSSLSSNRAREDNFSQPDGHQAEASVEAAPVIAGRVVLQTAEEAALTAAAADGVASPRTSPSKDGGGD